MPTTEYKRTPLLNIIFKKTTINKAHTKREKKPTQNHEKNYGISKKLPLLHTFFPKIIQVELVKEFNKKKEEAANNSNLWE